MYRLYTLFVILALITSLLPAEHVIAAEILEPNIHLITPNPVKASKKRQRIVIKGRDFQPESSINIEWTGGGIRLKKRVKIINDTTIELNIRSGSRGDIWYFQVESPDGKKSTKEPLIIYDPEQSPQIEVALPHLNTSNKLQKLILIGEYFHPASEVSISRADGSIVRNKRTTVVDSTRIEIEEVPGLEAQEIDIEVINPGNMHSNAIQIPIEIPQNRQPEISALLPPIMKTENAPQKLTLTGKDFTPGDEIEITLNDGSQIVLDEARLKHIDSDRIEVMVTSGLFNDQWKIRVRDPNGLFSNEKILSITQNVVSPIISELFPEQLDSNKELQRLTLRGTNFEPRSQVEFSWGEGENRQVISTIATMIGDQELVVPVRKMDVMGNIQVVVIDTKGLRSNPLTVERVESEKIEAALAERTELRGGSQAFKKGKALVRTLVDKKIYDQAQTELEKIREETISLRDVELGNLWIKVAESQDLNEVAIFWYEQVATWTARPADQLRLAWGFQRMGDTSMALKVVLLLPQKEAGKCKLMRTITEPEIIRLFELGDYSGVKNTFKRVQICRIDLAPLRKLIAWSHYLLGEFEDALKFAQEIKPKNADICEIIDTLSLDATIFVFEEQKYEQVLENIEQLKECNIPLDDYQSMIAWSYFHLKKYTIAEPLFESLYKSEPNTEYSRGLIETKYLLMNYLDLYKIADEVGGPLQAKLPTGLEEWQIRNGEGYLLPLELNENKDLVVNHDQSKFDYIQIGAFRRSKAGTSGLNRLDQGTYPAIQARYIHKPLHEVFMGFKQNQFNSGLYQGDEFSSPPTINQSGAIEVTVAYHNIDKDPWYFQIGNSPTNGAADSILLISGGFGDQNIADEAWSVELGRYLENDSLLSIGGLESSDYPNQVWGVVARDELYGRKRSIWNSSLYEINASIARYSGEGIGINSSLSLGGEIITPIIHPGLNEVERAYFLQLSSFSKNQSSFSPGFGGYFSPQTWVNLGTRIDLSSSFSKQTAITMQAQLGYEYYSYAESSSNPSQTNHGAFIGIKGVASKNIANTSFQLGVMFDYIHSPAVIESIAGLYLRYTPNRNSRVMQRDLYAKPGFRPDF